MSIIDTKINAYKFLEEYANRPVEINSITQANEVLIRSGYLKGGDGMTYDERLEIGNYLDIVKKNCERTLRSVEMLQDALGKIKCEVKGEKSEESAKENFLKRF